MEKSSDIFVARVKEKKKEEETGFSTTAVTGSDIATPQLCLPVLAGQFRETFLFLSKHKSSVPLQCKKQFLPPSNSPWTELPIIQRKSISSNNIPTGRILGGTAEFL